MATATQNENVNNMNMQETGKKRKQSNPSNQREKRSNPSPSNGQFEYLERRYDEAKSELISAKAEIKELLNEVEIECRVAGRLGRAIPEEMALALNAADRYSESESTNKSIESTSNRQETSRDHQTGMHRGVHPFPGASGPPMQTFGGPVPLGRHSRENPLPGRFEPPIRTFGGPVFPGRHCRSWREFSKGKKELKETQKKVDQATELVARLKGAIQLMKSTEKICESRLNKAISKNDSFKSQKLAELSASLQQSQDGLSAKTQEAESLRLELSEKEDTIKDLKEKLAVAKNQCEAISAEKEKLQNERDNLQSNMGALEALNKRLEELEEEKKASLAAMAVLQSEKENDEANFCIICMERPSDVAVVPCGHFCLCEECAAKCNNCPICRTEKESSLKIYVGNLTV